VQITSLPLNDTDRAEFIEAANNVFETVMWRMEPRNPDLTRKLWNVEDYVNTLLTEDMLSISKDYALSLIDAFLVHYVAGLAGQADQMTG
jgi:2-oxo-4-hydroxy-4-carboxy--5-ureidoimidazoline (OHCU) decarboxylase